MPKKLFAKRLFSITLICCFIINAFNSSYTHALITDGGNQETSSWTMEIYRTNRDGRKSFSMKDKSNYPDGDLCIDNIPNANSYSVSFVDPNALTGGDSVRTYQHTAEGNVEGITTNVFRVILDGNERSIYQCQPNGLFGEDAEKSDYWIVMKGNNGTSYYHKINDGMNNIFIKPDERTISYNVGSSGAQNIYSFGGAEAESDDEDIGTINEDTPKGEDLSDVYFTITDLSSCNKKSNAIIGDGSTEYSFSFKIFETDVDGYNKANSSEVYVNGAGSSSCNLVADSDGHILTVNDPKTNTAASFEIPNNTKSLRVKLSVVDGKIQMEVIGDVDSSGVADDDPDIQVVIGTIKPDPTCESSGAASALGWIVCPVLEWMSNAASVVYSDYIEPNLRVEPNLFKVASEAGAKSVTEKGWETFRNLANILFVILLLFIIFSQLTGVGIDNYGIKKTLPKLIVTAILVNLSFIICQACVDLSNIVGNGLQAIFNGFSSSLTIPDGIDVSTKPANKSDSDASSSTEDTPEAIADISDASKGPGTGGVITTVAILTGIFFVVGVIANPAILLTLLISALSVLVSILFLFVLLAGRKAIIIILTLVSPIAFASYIFPNTKQMIFNRWFKIWKAMLILYPICGLLAAGGNFMSNLLLSIGIANTGLFGALTAMLAGIIPIFFIPKMVKSTFSTLGKMGNAISSYGGKLSGKASTAMTNSRLNQTLQQAGARRRVKVKAGYNSKTGQTELGSLKSKIAGASNHKNKFIKGFGKVVNATGWSRAYYGYNDAAKQIAEQEKDDIKTLLNASETSKDAKKDEKRSNNLKNAENLIRSNTGNSQNFEAAIDTLVEKGQVSDEDLADIVHRVIAEGGLGKLEKDGSLRSVFERLNNKYGNGFLATDIELSQFLKSGGTANGGKLGGYGEFAKNNIKYDDLKPEDLSKLSSKSIATLASQGKITKEMADRVMSNNPDISADKKVMFGALASGMVDQNKIRNNMDQFIQEARNLASNPSSGSGNTIINANQDAVKNWTGATPMKIVTT